MDSLLSLSLKDMPLDDLLKAALDLIIGIPQLSIEARGAVFLVDDEPGTLSMRVQSGLSDGVRQGCSRVPFGRCLCGCAAMSQQVQYAAGLDERHENHFNCLAPHGHYCVPIVFEGATLGVINLYLMEGHQHNPAEEAFLTAMANTLAGAIQRSRTQAALRVSRQRQKALLEVEHDGLSETSLVGAGDGQSCLGLCHLVRRDKSGKKREDHNHARCPAMIQRKTISHVR
jgi:GAF domain-containing protein